jgi:hypothetical protein
MGKKKFTAKQRAAQKLFAKRARAGTLQKKRRHSKKKGQICFKTVEKVAKYMRSHGYKVVKK